jgi:hypothetical protein
MTIVTHLIFNKNRASGGIFNDRNNMWRQGQGENQGTA